MAEKTEIVEWPLEVKARAIALAVEHDAGYASSETGVPAGTIRKWLQRSLDQVRPHLPQDLQGVRSWHDAVDLLLDAIGIVSVRTLIALDEAVEQRKAKDARDYAVTLGILVEKAQLVSGAATQRTEVARSPAQMERDIARLEKQLGRRGDHD